MSKIQLIIRCHIFRRTDNTGIAALPSTYYYYYDGLKSVWASVSANETPRVKRCGAALSALLLQPEKYHDRRRRIQFNVRTQNKVSNGFGLIFCCFFLKLWFHVLCSAFCQADVTVNIIIG